MSIFQSVKTAKHDTSRYHWKSENKMSFNFGYIYPILTRPVLAGDTWRMSLQNFVRTVPLLSPVMHRNDIKVDAFYVPYRLIWDSYENYANCSEPNLHKPKLKLVSGSDATRYTKIFGESSLADYLRYASIPASELASRNIPYTSRIVNALPFRAYRIIYDYYFRNKILEPSIIDLDPLFFSDSDNVVTSSNEDLFMLQKRKWRRDMFTSALPTPQNGVDVKIPLGVTGTGTFTDVQLEPDGFLKLGRSDGSVPSTGSLLSGDGSTDDGKFRVRDSEHESLKYAGGLKVSGTGNVTGISSSGTIRQLRYAEMLEEFEEITERTGAAQDFKAWLKGIWGVTSSDSRLDRPEYLGGYRGPIQISEVPQTSAATSSSPQATLAGKGMTVGGKRLFGRRFFEEPGIVMVTMSIVPKSAYCQGDPREWLIDDCYEEPNPLFDKLGEQPVYYGELNALQPLVSGNPTATFGYQIRNYPFKSMNDEVHGALKSSLAYWHEGRIFPWSGVGLNQLFVDIDPSDVSRIFPSSETSDKLVGQFFFDIICKRRINKDGWDSIYNR